MWRSCSERKYPIKISLCMVTANVCHEPSYSVNLHFSCVFLLTHSNLWKIDSSQMFMVGLEQQLYCCVITTFLCFYFVSGVSFLSEFCLCQDVILLRKLAVQIQHTWKSTLSVVFLLQEILFSVYSIFSLLCRLLTWRGLFEESPWV